jgi:hypothetical protein
MPYLTAIRASDGATESYATTDSEYTFGNGITWLQVYNGVTGAVGYAPTMTSTGKIWLAPGGYDIFCGGHQGTRFRPGGRYIYQPYWLGKSGYIVPVTKQFVGSAGPYAISLNWGAISLTLDNSLHYAEYFNSQEALSKLVVDCSVYVSNGAYGSITVGPGFSNGSLFYSMTTAGYFQFDFMFSLSSTSGDANSYTLNITGNAINATDMTFVFGFTFRSTDTVYGSCVY